MKTFKDLQFKKHKCTLYAEILFHNNYGIDCYCLDNSINDKSAFIVIANAFNGEDYVILKKQTFGLLYKDYVEFIMKELQQLSNYEGEKK
jgi:hypothetical protein